MVTVSSYKTFSAHVRDNSPVALVTVIEGPHVGATMVVTPAGIVGGSLGNPDIDRIVARDALGELEAGRTLVRHYGPQGESTPEDLIDTATVRIFIESFSPPPLMWIFGAVDFTAALARVAKVLGYHVTVCDAREVFATRRSRKTHAKRLERMAEVGITSAADLARVHSPIGLDLGGRTPEETAISIVGEIIATRTGRNASPLGASDGAIH